MVVHPFMSEALAYGKKFELKKKEKTLAAVLVNLILKAFGIQ